MFLFLNINLYVSETPADPNILLILIVKRLEFLIAKDVCGLTLTTELPVGAQVA